MLEGGSSDGEGEEEEEEASEEPNSKQEFERNSQSGDPTGNLIGAGNASNPVVEENKNDFIDTDGVRKVRRKRINY